MTMASLSDVLPIPPVRRILLSGLPAGDLSSLSRTSSTTGDFLRDFEDTSGTRKIPQSTNGDLPSSVSRHSTVQLAEPEAERLPLCSEPEHVQGTRVRGCLSCAMPVCETCIIRASFGQRDDRTFASRARSLCPDCYNLGNAFKGKLSDGLEDDDTENQLDPGEPFCVCSAKDGHLCLKCKAAQKSDSRVNRDKCHGRGCSRTKVGGFPSQVCLWCGLRLPSEHNRVRTRREYDKLHLLARAHSTYEGPTEARMKEAAEVESARLESHSTGRKLLPKPPIPFLFDSFEDLRLHELIKVSVRRNLTAAAAEDARWARAEGLRRSDTKLQCPMPLRRQTTAPTAESLDWCDTDSIAPTLVERDREDQSDPSAYDDCNAKYKPGLEKYHQLPES